MSISNHNYLTDSYEFDSLLFMNKLNLINGAIKKYYLYLLSPLVFFYIGFHLINGNNGLLAHIYLDEEIRYLEKNIKIVSREHNIIEFKIAELQKNTNSDIRDEMIRKVLNFSQDNEYTIIFDQLIILKIIIFDLFFTCDFRIKII